MPVVKPQEVAPALIPPHIDGFLVQTDFRLSRFSAVGVLSDVEGARAEKSRPELELVLTLRGRALVLVGEQRVALQRHTMLWVLPRKPHLIIKASADYRAWVVVFRQRLVRRVCTTADSLPLQGAQAAEETHAEL